MRYHTALSVQLKGGVHGDVLVMSQSLPKSCLGTTLRVWVQSGGETRSMKASSCLGGVFREGLFSKCTDLQSHGRRPSSCSTRVYIWSRTVLYIQTVYRSSNPRERAGQSSRSPDLLRSRTTRIQQEYIHPARSSTARKSNLRLVMHHVLYLRAPRRSVLRYWAWIA